MAGESKFHVSLDRIEESIAVLITSEGHQWLMPAELLPEGAHEGDVVQVTMVVDPRETEKLALSVHELQQRLLDRTRERHE